MQGQGLGKKESIVTNDEHLTISQLANAADVPTTTIRYYERIGLVKPEQRSYGNYRLYGEKSLDKLNFIRAAQAIGFTLDDVRSLLGDGKKAPCCGDVKLLIEDRLEDIKRKLKDLGHVQRVLNAAHKKCELSNPGRTCHVVESLQVRRS